jgi:hypothetical protein
VSRESLARSVPSPVWVQVVTDADRQCQCTHVRCHVPARDRCKATTSNTRLIVAPTDPQVPEYAGWRLPVRELSAWCPSCLSAARRRGEAARVAASRAAGEAAQESLFDVPAVPVTSGGARP